jgi:hypothetical protein
MLCLVHCLPLITLCVVPQTLPVEGPVTSDSTATIFYLDHGFDGQVRSQRTHVLQPARGIFAHLRLPTTLALSRTPVVQSMKIATAQQTPIAREDLAVSPAHEPRGKQCIIRLESSLLSGSLTPDPWTSARASRGRTIIWFVTWCLHTSPFEGKPFGYVSQP